MNEQEERRREISRECEGQSLEYVRMVYVVRESALGRTLATVYLEEKIVHMSILTWFGKWFGERIKR